MPANLDVPQVAPVSLNGREYFVDYAEYRRGFISATRQSIDQQATPGETALNTEGAWIRSQTDWSLGGQQEVFDDEDSTPRRYFRQKDVQATRRGRIQLSNALQQKSTARGSVGVQGEWSERSLVQTGNSIFWIELSGGTYSLYRGSIANGPYGAFTPSAALFSGVAWIASLATDGSNFTWAARLTHISRATTEAGAWTDVWSTIDATYVAYCNGRLLGMVGPEIFEVDATGVTKTTIWTHGNVSWNWQGAVAGAGAIYAWGASNARANVYVINDVISGGALAPPKIALPMQPGEIIRHMEPISGLFIARTNLGVRLLYPQGDGSLTSGPLITMRDDPATDVPAIPRAVSAYADGVMVAWRDTSVQPDWISRLDLANFVNDAPAMHPAEYTADEAETDITNAAIGSLLVVNRGDTQYGSGQLWVIGGDTVPTDRRIWAASIFNAPDGDSSARQKSTTGYYYTGWITYGATEQKQPLSVKMLHEAIPAGASIEVFFVKPDNSEVSLGTTSVGTTSTELAINTTTITPFREFQLKFVFTRGTTPTQSPVKRSWALRAYVIPTRQEEIILPIKMQPTVQGRNRRAFSQDVLIEWNALKALVIAKTPVALIEGSVTTSVIVDSVVLPEGKVRGLSRRSQTAWWEGTWLVRCISVA